MFFDLEPDLIVCLTAQCEFLRVFSMQEIGRESARTPTPEKIHSLLSEANATRLLNEFIWLTGRVMADFCHETSLHFLGIPHEISRAGCCN